MQLRDYQQDILQQLQESTTNDLVQLDTGAGKTPIEAALSAWAPFSMLVAHRITLIEQISEKLAAFGLPHDTISTEYTRRRAMARHRQHRKNYIERGHSKRLVVSIDSLHAQLRRKGALKHIDMNAEWLIIIDEAHHVVPDNKWGELRRILPNARIVGFTATPGRMDGESLHISKGGLFDRLVQASTLGNDSARVLIERGYLSDFVVYAPQKGSAKNWGVEDLECEVVSDMLAASLAAELGQEHTTPRDYKKKATGLDYEHGQITLYGDPVLQYKERANGTQAILMAPAIKNAEQFALAFRDAGISAGAIHSTMPQSQITRTLEAFAAGRMRVICNVDMIGEGFDMPAVQTLIIASQTASFPRYRQWIGRVLRPSAGKDRAIILDLTRQVEAHGMPDDIVEWDLLNPPNCPSAPLGIPCDECGAYYKMRLRNCPHCGAENEWLKTGKPLGNFEFDVLTLNNGLVLAERAALNVERMQERLRTEIVWPHFSGCGGIVGRVVDGLRSWFVSSAQASGERIESINEFLASPAAADTDFWMRHFTAKDMQTSGAKAVKVFRQWQQSHSTR